MSVRQRVFGRLSRHDLLLVAIPLVFALALAVSLVGPVSREAALAVAGAAGVVCLADAFYFHPPVGSSSDP